jgi:hypothetical protein
VCSDDCFEDRTGTGAPVRPDQLNVAAEQHDLTAPDQLKLIYRESAANLSKLQKKILLALSRTDALPIRELVRKCFGKVSYSDRYGYQAAYASMSRAVRKLKNRQLLQEIDIRDIGIKNKNDWFWWGRHSIYSWVRLTAQGSQTVKSRRSVPSFNLLPPVKSVRRVDSFNLPPTRDDIIRVFVHFPDFQNELGRLDSEKLIAAVQELEAA